MLEKHYCLNSARIVIGINYVPHGGSQAALIALGFVVLAAYLIGELIEIETTPYYGYLLAGLVLGLIGSYSPRLYPDTSYSSF